jgi:hypothetical protein
MADKVVTNVHGLPGPILRAVLNDPYDAGKADISTTRLINPPQVEVLRTRYKDKIVEDASEKIWAMLGQAVHVIAERSAGKEDISEKRFFAPVEGWTISGAVDLIEGTKLIDYKVTSVWTYIYKSRIKEWTEQGNINRWLAYQNGVKTIESMENILILRDWSQKEGAKRADYPKVQVVVQPLELWPIEKAEAYVKARVLLHKTARIAQDADITPCTDEERWLNKGKYMRCEGYCAAKDYCQQRKRENDKRADQTI